MSFTTLTFLFFLASVFGLYWLLKERKSQNLLLVLASYVFYGWWDWRFCGLMLGASLVDYGAGLALEQIKGPRGRRAVLVATLGVNLGLLGFFKYFNFFAESFQALAARVGWTAHPVTLAVVLPVGISFYTFQTMSYTLDIYRRRMPATRHLIEYLAFVSFFPQLVAGPIERAINLLPQFTRERRFDYDQAVDGCRQILWGFLKKMLLADNLAPLVDLAYEKPGETHGAALMAATVFFAFQIYCDFSAYSDIAAGVARLFGFKLMRNFDRPYFSASPAEFWRRWHISLTTWFRDYVYIPLGGSRVNAIRRAINVMITFLLSGLWHGAAWNFAAWGVINGLALVPSALAKQDASRQAVRNRRSSPFLARGIHVSRMLGTFAFICAGWVFFRAAGLKDGWLILNKIATAAFDPDWPGWPLALALEGPLGAAIFPLLAGFVLVEWWQGDRPHPFAVGHWPVPLRWALYLGAIMAIVLWGTYSSTQFIYFQF